MPPTLRHLLVELAGCPADRLNDVDRVARALRECARLAGTTILSESLQRFEPHGVTGIVLLAESHASVHTWPEHGFAAFDLLSCRGTASLDGIAPALRAAFAALRSEVRVVERTAP